MAGKLDVGKLKDSLRSLDNILYTEANPSQGGIVTKARSGMQADKQDVLKRLNYIDGHLNGIRKMIEDDKYCVDVLRQTYAVRKAIEKLEALILENHLQTCVPDGIKYGREQAIIEELLQLYNLAGNR